VLSILVLPLYVPPLVFGAGAVEASASGNGAHAYLLVLAALTLAALALCPWASAAALRQALD
jgi:heme exporter protein B